MYCRKCGKQLLDDDNFCPKCGTPVAREAEGSEIIRDNGVVDFDPDSVPSESDSLAFNWNVEDFHRESKTEDIEIEWGDLLDDSEKERRREILDRVDEAAAPVTDDSSPITESIFGNSSAEENFGSKTDKFDTFAAKNQEFQELLNREKERLMAARKLSDRAFEEIGIETKNTAIEIEEDDDENKPSAAERVRIRREERAKRDETQIMEPVLPLKLDEDEIGGSWPPKTEEELEAEIFDAPVTEEEIPAEESEPETIEEMVIADSAAPSDSAKRAQTQQISREEFAEFLKKAEEEFGFGDIDEEVEKESETVSDFDALESIPEADSENVTLPEARETAAEDEEPEPVISKKEAKKRAKAEKKAQTESDLEFGNFEDESFWDDDYSYEEKKGGRGLTAAIVILAVILVIQIAVLIIRFQFPDSQLAGMIEPVMSRIEDWIRGLFG